MMVSLAAAHPSATSKVARARQGLHELALRRATRHATGVLPRNQLEIIGDGVRSFLNRATGALVAAAIHFPSGKVEKAVHSARGNWPKTPPTGRSVRMLAAFNRTFNSPGASRCPLAFLFVRWLHLVCWGWGRLGSGQAQQQQQQQQLAAWLTVQVAVEAIACV